MSESDAFRRAVEWLTPICEFRMSLPQFGPLVLTEVLWSMHLNIWLEYPGGPHSISEEAAQCLVIEARNDPGAFDLLTRVTTGLLLHDVPLYMSLRLFLVGRLQGDFQRPPAPRASHTNLPNLINLALILRASHNFSLPITRNVASEPHSACDALALAFVAAGRGGSSYASFVKLFEERHSQLRERAAQIVNLSRDLDWVELKQRLGIPDVFDSPEESVSHLQT